MKLDKDAALAALLRYNGDNRTVHASLGALCYNANDVERDVVAGSVAKLANSLPGCGPVSALEIIGAVGRLWARKEGAQ